MGTMNLQRASWARKALDAFAVETGQRPSSNDDELGEALGDLMCNLLHLARAKGFDPIAMHERAQRTFEGEEFDDE